MNKIKNIVLYIAKWCEIETLTTLHTTILSLVFDKSISWGEYES